IGKLDWALGPMLFQDVLEKPMSANRNRTLVFILLISVAGLNLAGTEATAQVQEKPNAAVAPIEDQAELPRVLLIGDSISIGYTLDVREMLKGEANVHRPPANCRSTNQGMISLDSWLGKEKWDVIHFN